MNKIKYYLKQTRFFKFIFEKTILTAPENEDRSLVRIDIGCGNRKIDGCIGVDKLTLPGVDIVHDLEKGLPFKDSSVDIIYAGSVLEFIDDLEAVMSEIHRILKKDTGRIKIFVPHFSSPHARSYIFKNRDFGYLTFDHFVRGKKQKSGRKVSYPCIKKLYYFEITKKELIFTSEFLILKFPAKLFQWIVNKSDVLARLWEYNFCYIYPAYGIRIEMKPDSDEVRITN
jgi:SAM-dependent methyltransferase